MLTQRPVNISCLTKSASTDTPSLNLQYHPVLGYLDKGNQRLFNIIHLVQLHHQLLCNPFPGAGAVWAKALDGSILMVGYIIKSRDIDSRNPGSQL